MRASVAVHAPPFNGGRPYSFAGLRAPAVTVSERAGKLSARATELAVGARQVLLGHLHGYEQALGDLPVRESLAGAARDTQFTGRERGYPGLALTAHPPARRRDLLPRPRHQRPRTTALSQLEALAQRRPRVPPTPRAP